MENNKEESIIGKTVSGYKILKHLGSGQFSSVYQAMKIDDNIQCALKIVKIFELMDKKERELCLGEVKHLQSLNHPGIIRYLESFISDNKLFIAIEWASKGDLKKLIRKHLDEKEKIDNLTIFKYLKTLASALHHMHGKRIMHRDLKPANILYTTEGVKIGDLGLGRYMSDSTCVAYSKVGTRLYMAPEILKEGGYGYTIDIWSLGCVLYEIITFKNPFRTDNIRELMNNVNLGKYKKLGEDVIPELRYLVDRMIQVDPLKRISLEEVLAVCDKFLSQTKTKDVSIDLYNLADYIDNELNYINFRNNFQVPTKFSDYNKYYFIYIIGDNKSKLQYDRFYQVILWIVYLIKNKISTELITPNLDFQAIFTPKNNQSREVYLIKEIADVLEENIKIEEAQIPIDFGDWCIISLNQVLDKYLDKYKMKFSKPNFLTLKKEKSQTFVFGELSNTLEKQDSYTKTNSNNKSGKIKFNKEMIMTKLDKLNIQKLENDYDYFSIRISDQSDYVDVNNNNDQTQNLSKKTSYYHNRYISGNFNAENINDYSVISNRSNKEGLKDSSSSSIINIKNKNNSNNAPRNSLFKEKLKISNQEDYQYYDIDHKLEKILDSFYSSFNNNKNIPRTKSSNLNSSMVSTDDQELNNNNTNINNSDLINLETIKHSNNHIMEIIREIKPTLYSIFKTTESQISHLKYTENIVFESDSLIKHPKDKKFIQINSDVNNTANTESISYLKNKLISIKQNNNDKNKLYIEKMQSIISKELKLKQLDEKLEKINNNINTVSENSNSQARTNNIQECIKNLNREVISLDLKVALFDISHIEMYRLKKKISELQSNKYSNIIDYQNQQEDNIFDELI